MAPHEPVMLCTATPSSLLYADWSKMPFEVHWLDMSDTQPKPAAEISAIHTQHSEMYDMCLVQDGDKQVLVAALGHDGVVAYNLEQDKLEWKVDDNVGAAGVTTGGRGHLFIADYDHQSIHLLRISVHICHRFWIKFPESLGYPAKIRWCEQTSSLIAACWSNGKWLLNVINVQIY